MPPPTGKRWVSRFITRHKYAIVPQKILDADRQAAKNQEIITSWFETLHNIIPSHGVVSESI